jgi:hypothetical protein
MRVYRAAGVLAALLILSAFCEAEEGQRPLFSDKQGMFLLKPPTGRQSHVGGTRVADLNGDGAADLVVWGDGPEGAIFVYLNKSGAFSDPPECRVPFAQCDACEVGDVDNDGRLDLLAFERGKDLKIYLNKGGGQFQAAPDRQLEIAGGTAHCLAGDFDKDGKTDLCVSSAAQGDTPVARQMFLGKHGLDPKKRLLKDERGGTSYGALTWFGKLCDDSACDFLAGPRWVALLPNDTICKGYFGDIYTDNGAVPADFDGDGATDILLTQAPAPKANNILRLFYGPFAHGVERPSWTYGFNVGPIQAGRLTEIPLGPLQGSRLPIVADLNGDGRPDILQQVAQTENGQPKWKALIYFQNQPMGFEPEDKPSITMDGADGMLSVADLNQDGFKDLVLMRHSPGRILIFLNRSGRLPANTDRPDQTLICTDQPQSMTIVDVTGDKRLDFVVRFVGHIVIYAQRGPGCRENNQGGLMHMPCRAGFAGRSFGLVFRLEGLMPRAPG